MTDYIDIIEDMTPWAKSFSNRKDKKYEAWDYNYKNKYYPKFLTSGYCDGWESISEVEYSWPHRDDDDEEYCYYVEEEKNIT